MRGMLGAAVILLFPAAAVAQEIREVNTAALNVRTGPGTSYSIVGQAHQGEKYAVVDTSGAWKKIYWAGNTAWFHGGYTIVGNGIRLRVTANNLNVRSGPGTNYAIVGQAHLNEIYVQKSTQGVWRQIWYGGAARWVHGNYVVEVTDHAVAGSVETKREGANSDENFLKTLCAASSSGGGALPALVLLGLLAVAVISRRAVR